MQATEIFKKRFWSKVKKTKNCWLWTGAKNIYGYGSFMGSKGKTNKAHRFSYLIHFGEIEKGLIVCHSCDNRLCVNPKHLFLGTHQDNMQDCKKKGRLAPQRGEQNSNSKLTAKMVEVIRLQYSTDLYTQKDIADIYGVSTSLIGNIIRRQAWKHI